MLVEVWLALPQAQDRLTVLVEVDEFLHEYQERLMLETIEAAEGAISPDRVWVVFLSA